MRLKAALSVSCVGVSGVAALKACAMYEERYSARWDAHSVPEWPSKTLVGYKMMGLVPNQVNDLIWTASYLNSKASLHRS